MDRAKSKISRAQAERWKSNIVRRQPSWLLASALNDSPEWRDYVAVVKEGAEPAAIARAYVPRSGELRDLIADMLQRAANATDDENPVFAMAPLILDFGDAPLGPNDPRRAIRGAPDDPDHSPPRPPSKERKRDYDAWETLRTGARLVARRGARRCLRCDEPLGESAQQPRRFYCLTCDARVEPHQRRYDNRAMTYILRQSILTEDDLASDEVKDEVV